MTLAVFGQWVQFPSERAFYRYALHHLGEAFPHLPNRSQFNRQQRWYRDEITAFALDLVQIQHAQETDDEVLDSTAAVTRDAKRRGPAWLAGQADIGWSNRVGWYEGFHLLLCVTAQGVITGFGFGSASTHDQHRIKGEENIYCISILENFSRAILSSAITRRQDTEAYLSVLYPAIRKFGVPEVLVSDSGGVFLSHDARKIYDALGIEKKEIKKGKPYQNYIEAAFGVQRRMADWSFESAITWEDLLAAHAKWLLDYNHQRHMAHEHRDDHCHSPAAVLNWQRGMQPEPDLIYRAFSAIGETRVLNKAGYAKFRNFLLYGEQGGLAGRETLINIFQDTLAVEYGEYPLSKYSVEWQPDDRHLSRVGNPRLYQHPYQTPQLSLWPPGDVEWHVIIRCQSKTPRKKRIVRSFIVQLPLSFEADGTSGKP